MSILGNQLTTAAFVTDTFSGNASTTAFTLSVAPATTSSCLVAISGVLQDPSAYSLVGTTMTFSAAPPVGVGNISVRYLGIPASNVTTTAYRTVTEFTATAGQTTFTVPSYTPGYLDVYRNGVRLGTTDFTASNGVSMVLAAGCAAGDLIATESFYVSSVLNAIPNIAGAINSSLLLAGAVTQDKLASGVAGNGPAFSAYQSGSQSISAATFTKVQCNVEQFDTANAYDGSTNYRFTPNIAGHYQVNGIFGTTQSSGPIFSEIRKNGGRAAISTITTYASGVGAVAAISCLVYLNGSTDYVELYGWQNGGASATVTADSQIQCFLARAA